MNKNIYFLTATVLLAQAVTVFGQISVSQSQMEFVFVVGDSLNALYSNDTTMDIGQTGGPNIYDLRAQHFSSIKFAIEVGSNIPLVAPHFPNDTILANPSIYNVLSFSGNEMLGLGHLNVISDTSYKVNFKEPGEVLFDFPITYNKTWSYSYTNYDTTYMNGNAVSPATDMYSRKTVVDGYGTLILPNGDSIQCLRVFQGPSSTTSDTGYGDFTFNFITSNGTFVIVDAPGNEPTTGKISIQDIQILQGTVPTSVQTEHYAPSSFSLYQNYPNPFNPTTAIGYQLSAFSHVTLKLYDVLGREVATLVDKEQNAGRYNIELSADKYQLASGIYYYRINAGGFSEVKKLMLMK